MDKREEGNLSVQRMGTNLYENIAIIWVRANTIHHVYVPDTVLSNRRKYIDVII